MNKILFVEDEKVLRETLVDLFSHYEYDLTTASNGEEAINYLAHNRPDIIVSDIMMPKVDGIQLLKYVKGNPSLRSIPFILLTAKIAQSEKIDGLYAGADDYITKPFDIQELTLRIKNLLMLSKHANGAQATATEDSPEGSGRFLFNLRNYLNEHVMDPTLNLETVSAHFRLSASGFQKKIKRLTQKSFSQFVREHRLELAKHLLETSTLNINEVADRVGFRNASYFSRSFREYFNYSPSEHLK